VRIEGDDGGAELQRAAVVALFGSLPAMQLFGSLPACIGSCYLHRPVLSMQAPETGCTAAR
jgi:hypothetical protein